MILKRLTLQLQGAFRRGRILSVWSTGVTAVSPDLPSLEADRFQELALGQQKWDTRALKRKQLHNRGAYPS